MGKKGSKTKDLTLWTIISLYTTSVLLIYILYYTIEKQLICQLSHANKNYFIVSSLTCFKLNPVSEPISQNNEPWCKYAQNSY